MSELCFLNEHLLLCSKAGPAVKKPGAVQPSWGQSKIPKQDAKLVGALRRWWKSSG